MVLTTSSSGRYPLMKILTYISITIIIVSLVSGYLFINNSNRNSALNTTLKWARLSSFPKCAKDLELVSSGSMFTREFVVEFTCPKSALKKWIDNSPGLLDAVQKKKGDIIIYSIKPGAGAQFAELTVNWQTNHVIVKTYWD